MMLRILTFLMSLPVASYDAYEGEWSRIDRLGTIAQAIADESNGDRYLAAFLIADGHNESAFRRDVQVCHCPRKQCDPHPKTGEHRANGIWQNHRAPNETREHWMGHCGLEYSNVRQGATRIATFYRQFKPMACAFARLGGQSHCDSKWAMARAREARWIAGKI